MKLRVELDADDTKMWETIVSRPEFKSTLRGGVISRLMYAYLNPPTHYTQPAHRHEPTEPEIREGAVATRKRLAAEVYLEERADKIKAGVVKSRAKLLPWPELEEFKEPQDGQEIFCFPGEYGLSPAPKNPDEPLFMPCLPWTPPEDYPQRLKDEWPAKFAKRRAYLARKAGMPVDDDPMPEFFGEDDTPEYDAFLVRRAAWFDRQNAPHVIAHEAQVAKKKDLDAELAELLGEI